MAKRADPRLAAGKKLIDEWGISLARLQDESVSLDDLRARLGQDPGADLALVTLLGDYAVPQAAQLLLDWEATSQADKPDKNLRRAIHRSLYKLSQKGVPVDRPDQEPGESVLTPVEPEGYLSSMDGHGDRLVWLVKPRIGGGLHYLSALINEPDGMRRIDATEVNRKGIKLARQDLAQRHQIALVEAPWRYCDFIMSEGYERALAKMESSGQTEQAGPSGQSIDAYPALRSHLLSRPAEATPVPLPDSLDLAAIAAEENWLNTSSQLFEEQDLQRWLLDQDQAKPYIEQMTQAQDSPLVLNKYQQQDRAQGIIATVLDELFSGDSARTYARRLEETAFHLAARSRLDSAKRALAVSLALKKDNPSGKGIPFCEDLVRQSIAVHYQKEHQHEQESAPGSLIMKPTEFAARMQAARKARVVGR